MKNVTYSQNLESQRWWGNSRSELASPYLIQKSQLCLQQIQSNLAMTCMTFLSLTISWTFKYYTEDENSTSSSFQLGTIATTTLM